MWKFWWIVDQLYLPYLSTAIGKVNRIWAKIVNPWQIRILAGATCKPLPWWFHLCPEYSNHHVTWKFSVLVWGNRVETRCGSVAILDKSLAPGGTHPHQLVFQPFYCWSDVSRLHYVLVLVMMLISKWIVPYSCHSITLNPPSQDCYQLVKQLLVTLSATKWKTNSCRKLFRLMALQPQMPIWRFFYFVIMCCSYSYLTQAEGGKVRSWLPC